MISVAFLPLLQAGTSQAKGHSASVIVISSMSGLMAHAQGHFSYNAAKGATVHLSKLMSAEFEKARIRVNSIAPGYFPSEMTMGQSDERQKTQMPKEKVLDKGHVPAMRPGSDEEMAQAVVSSTPETADRCSPPLDLFGQEHVRQRRDYRSRWWDIVEGSWSKVKVVQTEETTRYHVCYTAPALSRKLLQARSSTISHHVCREPIFALHPRTRPQSLTATCLFPARKRQMSRIPSSAFGLRSAQEIVEESTPHLPQGARLFQSRLR